MSQLRQQIISLLTEKDGNVAVVAKELGITEQYVHKVKQDHWSPQMALTPAQDATLTQADMLKALLPPNIGKVSELRDLTLGDLVKRVAAGELNNSEIIRLINVLLKYETNLRSVVTPAISVFQDNRTQITTLVDQLATLTPDALRALSGVGVNAVDGDYDVVDEVP